MSFDTIAEIIDLDRYPLHRPESPTVDALLREGQAALGRDALFSLPGFARPEAVSFMAAEIEARVPLASRLEANSASYGDDGSSWPAGHPRTVTHQFRYHQVLNHQIPNDSPLRKIFCWEPLREFLRQLMGYETFHRSECPHLALTSKVAGDGDTDGWHFDGNDVVFSILLREPEGGGVFEYIPNVRSDTNQNYETVAAVFNGNKDGVRRAKLAVGDLNVFQGNRTLHHVTPVQGARKRIVGLFSYDRQPGTNFGEPYVAELRRWTPGAMSTDPVFRA
ncbi:MAG: hypothetical protein EXQ94_01415 [Alphaproteobacteria bacterium]|nr:hypothetical protein [Alphaproteobacteria bacterium]